MDPYASARAVLPYVFRRVKPRGFQPVVVDVGCGEGQWLRAAKELGARTIGIDHFHGKVDGIDVMLDFDLRQELKNPYWVEPLSEQYDLAICLEVAEHLPADCGENLVQYLCGRTPVVLFSAAQPGQGPYPPDDATDENRGCWHVNERPIAYWAELFKAWGYQQLDVIRPRFERDVRVDPWYRSNAALYVRGE